MLRFSLFRLTALTRKGLMVLAFAAAVTVAHAQSSRGVVSGNVLDAAGAAVTNAEVTLLSPSNGTKAVVKVSSEGIYRFEAVLPGEYKVIAAAPGFSKEEQNATVIVGVIAGRDFKLSVGSASETVEVTAIPAELQTEDAVRSGTISSAQLAELPISGQNPLNLLLVTTPGVARSNTGSNQDGGIGSVNGARGRSNNFLIDGLQNNDISVAGPQFTVTNDDELQSITFLVSNFTAEFGRAGGAVINEITKSGTNQVHGTVAEVYRSEVLNGSTNTQRVAYAPLQATYLAAGAVGTAPILKPKFKENIPAFTVGGPVYIPHLYEGQNKTFFFGAGQWDRYSSGGSQASFTVPTATGYAVLQGLAATCPNVANYLSTLGPARGSANISSIDISLPQGGTAAQNAAILATSCNGSARTGQSVEVGTFTRAAPEISLDNNHLIRIDHAPSQRQNMVFRWLWDNNSDNIGGTIGVNSAFDVPLTGRTMSPAFNHTYAITPNLLNEFRFGFTRNKYTFFNNPGLADTLPTFAVTGLTTLQLSSTFPQGRISNNFQYQDSLTYQRGKHAIKGGVEFLRQLATQQAPYNSRGAYAYALSPSNAFGVTAPISALANFIDDQGGPGATASISLGSGRYHPNLFTWTLFAQDTYRVSPSLTLNYGLRYENFGQPANIFKYPAFVGTGDADIVSTAKINQDNNNLSPSLGFAYNPHSSDSGFFGGKFVIRGGYQASYDTFFNNLLSNIAAGVPNTVANATVVSTATAATPRGYKNLTAFPFTASAVTPYTSEASKLSRGIRNPYTHRFSLSVEQELPGKVVAEVGYVGSLGRQLFFSNNYNPILPDATRTTYAMQATPLYGTQYLRLFANRGSITIRDGGFTNTYHSLQIQVRRRAIKTAVGGFSFNTNYTYSKNLDTLNDVFATYAGGAYSSRSQTIAGPLGYLDHGPADTDLRHISSTIVQWQLPEVHNKLLNEFVGGWSLSPVLLVQSGSPYTVLNGADRDLDGATAGDRPDIGNPNAPVNTRGVVTAATNCASGYYDPAKRIGTAAIGTACVSPNDVRFLQVTTYSPTSAAMESRNSIFTTRYLDLDVNILKKFRISERLRAELGGEFFNVTNNQNFNTPSAASNVTTLNGSTFQNFSGVLNGGSRTLRVRAKVIF